MLRSERGDKEYIDSLILALEIRDIAAKGWIKNQLQL